MSRSPKNQTSTVGPMASTIGVSGAGLHRCRRSHGRGQRTAREESGEAKDGVYTPGRGMVSEPALVHSPPPRSSWHCSSQVDVCAVEDETGSRMKWRKSRVAVDARTPDVGQSSSTADQETPGAITDVRRRFGSRLTGAGIEIGPGGAPFPLPDGVKVCYIDQWKPTENSSLFPELGGPQSFPEPDMTINLDVDRLDPIADQSQDFVVASHVLEHLANPLAMLVEIHRVLKQGGLLALLLPDRHLTFDSQREPTPLAHLVDEYGRDIREVDDAHIMDFIMGCLRSAGDERETSVLLSERTADEIEMHRRRSVHAHVWDMSEFQSVLDYARDELGVLFDVLDRVLPGDEGSQGNEFGWLLERVPRISAT
jgi:SAM-dependent methyltransferase